MSNLSAISSDVIRSALLETITQHLNTKHFNIELASASKNGDNFIGIVNRITFHKVGEEKTSRSTLILKIAPTNPARRQRFFSRPCFAREIFMYNEVNVVS